MAYRYLTTGTGTWDIDTIGRIHFFAGSWSGLWSSFLNRNTDPTWPDFENVYKKNWRAVL